MKVEFQDKRHGLRGHASIYDVNFEAIASTMIMATANHDGIARFRIAHCSRVKTLALKLVERSNLSIDQKKVAIMCDLHDMYEYVTTQKHGKMAAKFLEKFVGEYYPQISGDKVDWMKVIEAIEHHSNKTIVSTNQYLWVLQDADMLDKISTGYIENWYNVFTAESIAAVAKTMAAKVDKYNGRTQAYNDVRAVLMSHLAKYDVS